jgi:hypothetical protein
MWPGCAPEQAAPWAAAVLLLQVRRDGREVGRREEEARVEVDRQVRARGRRAAEDVHAIVERAREVDV